MSGPLDDALAKQDRQAEQLQRQLRDYNVKMQALVADFLRRMNAAGNPGTRNLSIDWAGTWPVIPRLGWEIKNEHRDLRIYRTGKVLTQHPMHFGPAEGINLGYYGFNYDEYAQAMASILRQHGVRLCTEPKCRQVLSQGLLGSRLALNSKLCKMPDSHTDCNQAPKCFCTCGSCLVAQPYGPRHGWHCGRHWSSCHARCTAPKASHLMPSSWPEPESGLSRP